MNKLALISIVAIAMVWSSFAEAAYRSGGFSSSRSYSSPKMHSFRSTPSTPAKPTVTPKSISRPVESHPTPPASPSSFNVPLWLLLFGSGAAAGHVATDNIKAMPECELEDKTKCKPEGKK